MLVLFLTISCVTARQVAVRMDFVMGSAVNDETELGEEDIDDLCSALVFLAKQGFFVYTDFRPQNVIRSERDGRIILIDYDDMRIVSSLSALERAYDMVLSKIVGPGFNASVRKVINRAVNELKSNSLLP